jgi:hypothetical protein
MLLQRLLLYGKCSSISFAVPCMMPSDCSIARALLWGARQNLTCRSS